MERKLLEKELLSKAREAKAISVRLRSNHIPIRDEAGHDAIAKFGIAAAEVIKHIEERHDNGS